MIVALSISPSGPALHPGDEEGNLDGGVPRTVKVTAGSGDDTVEFDARLRIDTPGEADYYRHGGIMQYVLRSLLKA